MKIPQNIEVIEVGPRDGFQNIAAWIPTETKLTIIEDLITAGFKKLEITSFVHPKAIPQMADASTILETILKKYGNAVTAIVLVPNLYGARRAIELGAHEITYVISASEHHNLENTRQTIASSVEALKEVCTIKGSTKVRLAIATTFDCPFAGKTPYKSVIDLIEAGLNAGVDEIALCDTIGTANPIQVESTLAEILPRYPLDFILHLHDTQGMGLANVITAMQSGIFRFETSVGGLGGCPFAPGAAGNIATEDLVNMLHEMNISTGIDLKKLIDVSRTIETNLALPLTGHMVHTGGCKK